VDKVSKSEALCFDDVLLEPQYSNIQSRHDIDVMFSEFDGSSLEIGTSEVKLPIFASPMDTVVDSSTAKIMSEEGVIPLLHRYCSIEEQLFDYKESVSSPGVPVGAAVGVTGDYEERAQELYHAGCRIFCLDIAHGHHQLMKEALQNMKHLFGDETYLMAGNIATRKGFEDLVEWGADFVRAGVGGGSVCSTRIITGHGTPTLQTVLNCADSEADGYIVADGGIRSSGDIVKAFAAGADFVMLGSMLSCHNESPGSTWEIDGKAYKNYRGMASKDAQIDWRGHVSVAEGVNSWQPTRGNLASTIREIVGGVRSGCSYSGVDSVSDLSTFSRFVRVSSSSVQESKPHAKGVDLS